MSETKFFKGFSKLSASEKLHLIANLCDNKEQFINEVEQHKHSDPDIQESYQEFSENSLTNYFLPFGIAPNFLINNKVYHVPMVTEESSVVAAAAAAAKFWSDKGGFKTIVRDTIKKGQIHFLWKGDPFRLEQILQENKAKLNEGIAELTQSMKARGGGVLEMELLFLPEILEDYYQLDIRFETVDSMGANFINSTLEALANKWKELIENTTDSCEILMCILSNYTPECLVECRLETEVKNFENAVPAYSAEEFVARFIKAVTIAEKSVDRAVTHNKGIFNGIDAVVLATGNDFRSVEANGHAYASREGSYSSLSHASIDKGVFSFSLELPLSVGTVGGLTRVHPMAKRAFEILGWPDAREIMQVIASVGLANNFSAIRSLVSKGIQAGHMKLHLSNILTRLKASSREKQLIREQFKEKTVSFMLVMKALELLRSGENE